MGAIEESVWVSWNGSCPCDVVAAYVRSCSGHVVASHARSCTGCVFTAQTTKSGH
jgi:hypothetical protein